MQLKSDEISKIIKDQIKTFDNKIKQEETGSVIQIGDGIARVHGQKAHRADGQAGTAKCGCACQQALQKIHQGDHTHTRSQHCQQIQRHQQNKGRDHHQIEDTEHILSAAAHKATCRQHTAHAGHTGKRRQSTANAKKQSLQTGKMSGIPVSAGQKMGRIDDNTAEHQQKHHKGQALPLLSNKTCH